MQAKLIQIMNIFESYFLFVKSQKNTPKKKWI